MAQPRWPAPIASSVIATVTAPPGSGWLALSSMTVPPRRLRRVATGARERRDMASVWPVWHPRATLNPMRPLARNDPRQYDALADQWWQPGGGFEVLHWLARARGALVPPAT